MLKELLVLATLAVSTPSVIDGDTIRSGGVLIRLQGYDAPAIDGRCTEEVRRAHLARSVLKRLLADNALRFEFRKCRTPTDGWMCAEAFFAADDKPIAWHMVSKGLGIESHKRKAWCDVR